MYSGETVGHCRPIVQFQWDAPKAIIFFIFVFKYTVYDKLDSYMDTFLTESLAK